MGCFAQSTPPSVACLKNKGTLKEKIGDLYKNFCDELGQQQEMLPAYSVSLSELIDRILEVTY
ncbi:MAG: hypothetical protein AAFP93_01500 [Bacteroidota bacterium]